MLIEIEEESPREVVPLLGPSGTVGSSVSRTTQAAGEAASGSWAIGDPFADDTLHDDGNSHFPAGDQPVMSPSRRRASLTCGDRRPTRLTPPIFKREGLPPWEVRQGT